MPNPKITFIGAGSTVFMKNIVGDVLQRAALRDARIALMDINPQRLEESAVIAGKLVSTLGTKATIETFADQRAALAGADFVVVCFQIGGYDPATITDFEVPKRFGLRQTIADSLGIGGIMRGIRTVPHLWKICEDMLAVCPQAIMLQYVNPMAINIWAIAEKYPAIRQVGLCHSVQGTALELSRDLEIDPRALRYRAAGINHMAFYLEFEQRLPDGTYKDLYPDLLRAYREGRAPKPSHWNKRQNNKVRYEMLTRLGYFVTESSEHFAEYVPWFIKDGREDLIEKFGIPLDEYPKRCIEQIARWKEEAERYKSAATIEIRGQPRICLRDHELGVDRPALGHLRQCEEPGADHFAARGLRGGSTLPRRCLGHPADPYRRPAAAAHGADPHQHQCAGTDGRGAADGEPRAHLSRCHDGPAYGRRARPRPDLGAGRRTAGGAR